MERQQQLRVEQIRQLCALLPMTLSSGMAVALLSLVILWPMASHVTLLAWIGLLALCYACRLPLIHQAKHLKVDDVAATRRLQLAIRLGCAISGAIWGSSGLLLASPNNEVEFTVLAFVIGGISAGAALATGAERGAALAFLIPASLPTALRFIHAGDRTHVAMGLMMLLYGIHVALAVLRSDRNFRENVGLQIDALHREQLLAHSESRYRTLAHHDSLTGLPNRHGLELRLKEILARCNGTGSPVALLYLDLDNFKDVNDAHGHAMGDRMLMAVAQRLRSCAGPEDLIVRVGGDEFIIVTAEAERSTVEQLAVRIADALAAPLVLDRDTLAVYASIGIGLYPEHGTDAESLMKHADIALYDAKAKGRNVHHFFEPGMSADIRERAFIEQALSRALGTDELYLHYQPVVSLIDGRLIGLEALVRWQHPERGAIPATTFIPIAEQCGLIELLGNQVLREACRQLQAWEAAGLKPVPVAVNVSARQFDRDRLTDSVRRVLKEFDIDPKLLRIEITESMLMSGGEAHLKTLRELRQLGVSVAIDDFGTGYSSLGYLKHLPIDCLKIDRCFVRDMITDERDASIVKAVLAIAHSLDVRVVAEGVEAGRQAAILRELGCDAAQGYHFHAPLPAASCEPLLAKAASRSTSDTLRMRILNWTARAS
jgi:diguanylate cyclase (GGDEF)-like protein